MSPSFFASQMQRLVIRFGQRSIDPEFSRLVWQVISGMSESGFQRTVDVMIGSRTHHKPPLLSDFREAILNENKTRFENGIRGGIEELSKTTVNNRALKAYLAKEFPGCKNLIEATAVRKLQIQVSTADDPNYDPTTDLKFA